MLQSSIPPTEPYSTPMPSTSLISPLPASPLPLQQRRLSARRGSSTASDPFNAHASLNHHAGRASSSRLTIVRVIDPNAPNSAGIDSGDSAAGSVPSSPVSARRSFHSPFGAGHHGRRSHQTGGGGSGGGGPESPRLSFANNSFGRPSSPTALHHRPRSPGLSRTSSTTSKRLPPEEIVRLARDSASGTQAYVPLAGGTATSAHASPAGSPTIPQDGAAPETAPASFTELPDNIWLPFVDRPAEVTQLITTPPCARLFALLAQTLSPGLTSFPTSSTPPSPLPSAADDSKTWSWEQLDYWLRNIPRADVDDRMWVRQARVCVLSHSELIWERIKGALGVPPELDTSEIPPTPPARLRAAEGSAVETDEEELTDPEADADVSASPDETHPPEVSIEPLVRSNTPPPPEPTPGGGLGDIGEEDEEEETNNDGAIPELSASTSRLPKEEIVHGLRICTIPLSMSGDDLASGSPALVPFASPHMKGGPSPAPSVLNLDRETSGRPRSYSSSSFGSVGGAHDTERVPGHPLFPSSFSQISHTPSLSRSDSTRSNSHVRLGPSSRRSSLSQQRRLPLFAEGYDPDKTHEYAVSAASAGSVRGDDDH